MKKVALGLIRFYQLTISQVTTPSCRYIPSCSQYGHEAIERHGFFKGSWMTAKRLARCHPFSRGGIDPVP